MNETDRSLIQILNLCLSVVFLVVAYLSLVERHELIETNLGRTILLMVAIFWFLRMIQQAIFFTSFNRYLSALLLIGSLILCLLYLFPVLEIML